jgi:hypothetical protein
MSDAKDGGPAFPRTDKETNLYGGREGMSLRDWFASQALAVVATLPGRRPVNERGTIYDCVAEDAYTMADSMLKARSRGNGGTT